MNQYTIKFSATCPNDGAVIQYTMVVESNETIMVEDLIRSVRDLTDYQEIIADSLFEQFGGKQIITGIHQGIKVVTRR